MQITKPKPKATKKDQWTQVPIKHPGSVTKILDKAQKKNTKPKKQGAPIDSQGQLDLSALAAQRLNFLDQYNQQLADINRNYGVQKQRANENEPYVQRSILSDYAGRGMAHSTGYGTATGRETQLFNQKLADLDYAHTYGIQDLGTQKEDFMRTLQLQQQAARQAAADRLAQQAGTLGLYNSNKPPNKHQVNSALGIKTPHSILNPGQPQAPKPPKQPQDGGWGSIPVPVKPPAPKYAPIKIPWGALGATG